MGGGQAPARSDLPSGPRGNPPASYADLAGRLALLSEQVEFALSEIALCRAAFRRACEEEFPGWPWLPAPVETLVNPRAARALAAELAAVQRLRLWAQELHELQELLAARRPPPPPAESAVPPGPPRLPGLEAPPVPPRLPGLAAPPGPPRLPELTVGPPVPSRLPGVAAPPVPHRLPGLTGPSEQPPRMPGVVGPSGPYRLPGLAPPPPPQPPPDPPPPVSGWQ